MSTPSPERDPRASEGRQAARTMGAVAILAAGLAMVIRVPALRAGFVLDDFVHMAMARGIFPVARAPWDLFSFVRNEGDVALGIHAGAVPWWTDPDLRLAFFRPLSSLLAAFDAKVLGPSTTLQHAHSALWLAALVGGSALLFFRMLSKRAAIVATFAFALEEGLTTPLAWVANRSALVSSTFAVFALACWNRRRHSRRAAILCEAFTVLAILGGEYGLGVLFIRAALLLAEHEVSVRARVRSAIGLAVALGTYGVAHRALGYGVASFPLYRDPTTSLPAYLGWALEQTQRLLQDLVLGVGTPVPPSPLVTGIALGVLAWLFALAWNAPDRGAGRYGACLALGGLASFAPLASSIAHTRLLILPALGISALVGTVLARAAEVWRSPKAVHGRRDRIAAAFAIVVFGWIHLPQAAFRSWTEGGRAPTLNRARLAALLSAPVASGDRVVLLSAGDPTTILYFREVRALFGATIPEDFRVLTASPTAERLLRVDDRTLEIALPRSGLLASPLASVMRQPEKTLPPGTAIQAGPLSVTVMETGPLGPSRIRFRFDQSLDDPKTKVLISRPRGLEVFPLPPIGEERGVPPGADPCEGAAGP